MKSHQVSIAIMTHNEHKEIGVLLSYLTTRTELFDEIVIVDDNSDDSFLRIISDYDVRLFSRSLNENFSEQRNYLKSKCRGDFIFVLDPDELPSARLSEALPDIIAYMHDNNCEVCSLPRLNILHGADEVIDARRLDLSQDLLHEQPEDYQVRIIANRDHIFWVNRVHERVVGAVKGLRLPNRLDYCLIHVKSRSRQAKQNSLYDDLSKYSIVALAKKMRLKPLARRLGFVKEPVWAELKCSPRDDRDRMVGSKQ